MSNAINIRQLHVVIDAPAEAVFDFVSDVRNLPAWAIHFCKGIRLVPDGAIVTAPSGEMYFGTTGDRDLGVVDWWAGPTIEKAERWPTRIVPIGNRSLYTVTMIFGAQVPPAVEQHLTEELANLKRLVEAAHAEVRESAIVAA